MTGQSKAWGIWAVWVGVILAIAAVLVWHFLLGREGSKAIASANGRIEATEIDVAAKYAGRIKSILADEGDFVTAGQVVAQMDTEVLQAQLRQAQAQAQQAQNAIATTRSKLAQRQSEKVAAEAVVVQRQAELDVARKRSARADDDQARVQAYEAAINAGCQC